MQIGVDSFVSTVTDPLTGTDGTPAEPADDDPLFAEKLERLLAIRA